MELGFFRTVTLLSISLSGSFAFGAADLSAAPKEALPTRTIPITNLASHPRHLVDQLRQHGITLNGLFVQDWSREWDSGGDAAYGFGRYSLDLTLIMDADRLVGWKGATASVRLKQHIYEFGDGDELPEQLYSNIEAPSRTTLYELWLEQKFAGNRLRLKLGKFDSNTEFAAVEGAGDFLNSSMGFSPTIASFPSYPEPKPGVGMFFSPIRNYEVKLGIFQSAGSEILSLVEPGRRWSSKNDLPGRLSIGYWRRDGSIKTLDGNHIPSTQGIYSVFEQYLWRQALKGRVEDRTLSTYVQLGQADSRVSMMSLHAGGGMVLQAPIERRSQDSIGLGMTWVRMSDYETVGTHSKSELILESYYKLAISTHFSLVEDFQYLHQHPEKSLVLGGPVVTSRVYLSF